MLCLVCAGDLQAILVSNPKIAAAVAEICMVGLATTVQATKGPPKPDKARIDRLSYVVSEHSAYSLLATLHLALMQEFWALALVNLRFTAHCGIQQLPIAAPGACCTANPQAMFRRFPW